MELAEAIKGRRSVRKFKSDSVPKDVLESILDLAIWAPSGMNRQEWYFVVVQDEKVEEIKKIFEVSQKLLTSMNTEDILEFLLDALAEVIHFDAGVIFLFDPETKKWRITRWIDESNF